MRFHTTLLLGGKTATGIVVPDHVVDALGRGKRPPVTVTINGFRYRSTIAVMRGQYLVGVSAENRAGAGIAAGDQIEVDIEVDEEPRAVAVPEDFAAALAAEPAARQKFDALSYSHQLQHVLAIEAAKAPATRRRRIDGALAMLRTLT